ncbi:MAG TPA: ATP-binding protein [Stellaceae bacterium]|nr:ATP-binding protein [Stellaceae bacterium]
MSEFPESRDEIEARLRATEESLRIAQATGGLATFECDLATEAWRWPRQTASLFGFGDDNAPTTMSALERAIFFDDRPKLRGALETATRTGVYYVEFRVTLAGRGVRWLAARGTVEATGDRPKLRGLYYDISERKGLEARLLALNETLEARLAELREESHTLEIINETGIAIAGELGLPTLVQRVTDAGVAVTGAQFGAFFYNLVDERGESYTLYTLSGVSREAFSQFPMPRNTAIFGPTFRGEGPVRSDDILADARYGKNPPYHGMPQGHLPVRSYLAVPVVSRSGDVIGGLFFGHPDTGVFTRRDERVVLGIAAQAAIAVDNARLFDAAQKELAARREVEEELRHLNETLEARVTDETKRREKIEESLRQSQKMEAIGQLTGGVAHDFNNLMTVVIGNLDIVKRQLPQHHEFLRPIESALAGGTRAAQLTQRLLAFARSQPLDPRPLALNKLVAGMSDLLGRTLGEAIAIETVLAGGLWLAHVDSNQLENAVLNLAVNARDAMPDGGRLTIETANCHLDEAYAEMNVDVRPGQYVSISVTDTGKGMPPDISAKAFDPFFTTKERGHGTGLGLSQVYGFVKQSGGHVKIYSEVGRGTTVRLYFPRYQGQEAAVAVAQALDPPRGNQSETVLIVEDDPEVRDYSVEIVSELGYRVLSAEDGATALRLLDLHPEVKLLFTDVGLPHGMSGRRLADEARRRRPNLKVLFTTGYARNAIVHQGRLDPGVELVTKPFTYTALAVKLRYVLDS